ncbi:MAG TPA: glycerophosphodiester phosphodiesterase [Longimicrobiales bacterium]|nr:glycerophosphodiester phosphodiesterase [Longimicrobiales bacterium]
MAGSAVPHPFFDGAPHLIAHRGGAALAPENTLVAVEQAVRRWRADMVEVDVHATADGRCVLMHDDTVDRTTDGSGPIAAHTLAELRRLDAGYRFAGLDGAHSFRGRGVVVPTIEEVLEALPDTRLIVELKTSAAQRPLFDAIRRAGAQDRVLAAAAHDRDRDLFETYDGPVSESGDSMARMYRLHRLHLARLWQPRSRAVQFPLEHEGRRVVSERLVRELRKKGLVVQVWTVNEPEDMRRLLDWGVDGVLSDRPDVLAEVMGRCAR